MTAFETSGRFLRPDDLRTVRRNRQQVQAEHLLVLAGRLLFVLLVLMLGTWIYQRTQKDERFAVRSVEIAGVKHTSPAALEKIKRSWVGLNLFKLDIDRIQHDLSALPWVASVSIEKKLPSTLRITVVERRPVALAAVNGMLRYVDPRGKVFADLSPAVGNADLPLITNARGRQVADCVSLLSALSRRHPALFSRVSEISPAGDDGFLLFDRDLRTRIYLDGEAAVEKWKTLYAVAAAEGYRVRPAEYVDLRFADRIIVKPTTDPEVIR